THEAVEPLPQLRAAQLGSRLAQHEDDVAGRARVTWDGAVRARQQADHPHYRRRVHRAGGALIVEGDIPTGHRRVPRPAGIGYATTALLELVKHRRPFGTPEVQAVGDAQRSGARTGDVAGRL